MSKPAITVIKHAENEGPGTLGRVARALGHEVVELEALHLSDKKWAQASEAPIVLIMGGAMGVYEAAQYPFLSKEIELLQKRILQNQPTFGICLGAQLMAAAAGATVVSAGRREVGWFEVETTAAGKADPLIGALEWSSPVFHWHGDTFDAPKGSTHLLRSARFEQQGFCLSPVIYGLQFHIEVVEAELPEWIESAPEYPYGKADGVQAESEILEGGRRFAAAQERQAGLLIEGFLRSLS